MKASVALRLMPLAAALSVGAAGVWAQSAAPALTLTASSAAAAAAASTPPAASAPLGIAPQTLDVNTASQAELEQLPGVGPQLSARILAARAQGLFTDWLNLRQRVSGLGPATARKLSTAGLRVAGQAFSAP